MSGCVLLRATVLAVIGVAVGCRSTPEVVPATDQRAMDRRLVDYPPGFELRPFAFIDRIECVCRSKLVDVGAAHVATPSSSRNRIIPSRILVLIVPSATPRSNATSL